MTQEEKKKLLPYSTYKVFTNFIAGLRETNDMPSQVSYDELAGSNSTKATMMSTLKSLNLIDNDGVPTEKIKQLADSNSDFKKKLGEILHSSYPFLSDEGFDLKNTTTKVLEKKFRECGARDGTLSKSMTFFLSACRDANMEVSRFVKPIPSARGSTSKKKEKKRQHQQTCDYC